MACGRAAALLVALVATAAPAQGQDLLDLLVRERFAARAHAALEAMGVPAPMPPVRLPTPADTVFARFAPPPPPQEPPAPPPFADATWRHVRRLEAGWFTERYGEVRRAFLGANALTPLDTTWTRVLRAHLEDRFGSPTRAVADYDWEAAPPAEPFQFEYWFVVNDSIPFVVTDVGGPFERGLIISADARLRDDLPALRDAFYRELTTSSRPVPYVDYVVRGRSWYRAGYDGDRYFVDPIARPSLRYDRPLLRRSQQRE